MAGVFLRKGEVEVLKIFRERRKIVRLVLWLLVGSLVLGLIGSTVVWYLEPAFLSRNSSSTDTPVPSQERSEESPTGDLASLQVLLKQYEAMAAERPGDLAVLSGYARVEKELGWCYSVQGDQEQAKLYFSRAASHYEEVLTRQEDKTLRFELAGVYQALKEFGKAEAQLNIFLAKDPQNLQAWIQKGFLKEAQEDWAGAAQVWAELARKGSEPEVRSFAQMRLEWVQGKPEMKQGLKK